MTQCSIIIVVSLNLVLTIAIFTFTTVFLLDFWPTFPLHPHYVDLVASGTAEGLYVLPTTSYTSKSLDTPWPWSIL